MQMPMTKGLEPVLRTAAWYGDLPLLLEFPSNWEVQTFWPQTPPRLTDEEIEAALENTVGQPPIRLSSRGKTRPLVIVDDLNRPSPVSRVMPFILRHFERAGISPQQVAILMARGTHGPPGPDGMLKKVGAEAASCCRLVLHDPKGDNSKIGRTSYGTPVLVNREILASDFIIGIGGLYPNNTAGYGGGSKLALGALDQRSISYLHHLHRSVGWGSAETGDFRKDVDEIARMIGLHTSVALQIDAEREVVRVRCGDAFLFYPEELAFARRTFRAPVPEGADVVISNAYPNDLSFTFLWMKGMVPLRTCGAGASRIAIASCSEGLGSHGVYPVVNIPRFHEKRDLWGRLSVTSPKEIAGKLKRLWRRTLHRRNKPGGSAKGPGQPTRTAPQNPIWLYRPGHHATNLPSAFRDLRAGLSWPEIVQQVGREQGKRERLKVFLYPCAPLQFLEGSEAEFVPDAREAGQPQKIESR